MGEESDHDDLDSNLVGVRAYQVQMDDDDTASTTAAITITTKENGKDEGVIVSYYERSFPIGSLFSFPVQATAPTTKGVDRNPATVTISSGSKLSIHTVSIDPETPCGEAVGLYVSTNTNPDYLCICPCLNSIPKRGAPIITSLNVEVCGPSVIHLAAHEHSPKDKRVNVNVFGTVSVLKTSCSNAVAEAKKSLAFLPIQMDGTIPTRGTNDLNSIDRSDGIVDDTKDEQRTIDKATTKQKNEDDTKTPKLSKNQGRKLAKRKVTELEEQTSPPSPPPPPTPTTTESTNDPNAEDLKEETTTEIPTQPMTKKQRRKLAKQKTRQLEESIARERGYPIAEQDQASNHNARINPTTKTVTSKSLTRQRSLPGGIILQDILHGIGPTARTGRKVAIHYKGTFPETGKVFDKNQTKGKPLVFRVGTGEVIQGLERGIEGMKVGGERVITIPPKFGYGKMGQPEGGIPKNARLCFDVTLVSVGGNV